MTFLLFPLIVSAQMEDIQIKPKKVTENVYYLLGRGGNIGVLIGDEGVLLVDDQFAPLSIKIEDAVHTLTTQEIEIVFNTHYHGDHTGGNEHFKRSGATIMAHQKVKDRLSKSFEDPIRGRTVEAKSKSFWPTLTFNKNVDFTLYGENISIIHVSDAHTDGDMIIYFRDADVIHAGDAFVRYGYPYIDVSAGGSIDGMIAAQEKILSLANQDTKIIPGHGDLATKKEVKELHTMLVSTRKIIADEKEKGTKLEDLIPMEPLKSYHERWSGSFINSDLFVQLIYESLPENQ